MEKLARQCVDRRAKKWVYDAKGLPRDEAIKLGATEKMNAGAAKEQTCDKIADRVGNCFLRTATLSDVYEQVGRGGNDGRDAVNESRCAEFVFELN